MRSNIDKYVYLISIFITLFDSFQKAIRPRYTTDFASFLLSSIGQSQNLGLPYVEIWGINPPGLLLIIDLWNRLFGYSLLSFHFLYSILIFCILTLSWKILERLFELPISLISWLSFSLILMNDIVLSQFFPSEIPGLFFLIIGLFLTIVSKNKNRLSQASFFFVFAFFVKDVFFAAILCLLPELFTKARVNVKNLILIVSGALLALIFNVSYLLLTKSFLSYIEVLRIKRLTFITTPRLILENFISSFDKVLDNYMMLPSWLIVTFLIIILFAHLPKIKQAFSKNFKLNLTLIILYLGLLTGYAVQGRYNNKYDIPLILPSILVISSITTSLISNKRIAGIALSILILPSTLVLNKQISKVIAYNPFDHIQRFQAFENDQVLEMENYIKLNTVQGDCIIKIYGWGVADAYIYTKRKPCTRHFLTNILPESMKSEYRQQLIASPPSAIIYTTYLTDTDIGRFEDNIFDYTEVINNCYERDRIFEELYWPIFKEAKLSECIRAHSFSSSR